VFAADSTQIEAAIRTGNYLTWITNRITQFQTFNAANSAAIICLNILAPRCIVFSSVCDWNLVLTTDSNLYNGQCYATNGVFKI
jgi:hypothetical protein